MASTCPDITTEGTYWRFCPSLAASYILAICFALTSIAHVAQSIIHKRAYCWVIIVSALMQLLAYIFRILSILNPTSFGDYAAWFILILVAPLFTNAFAYMVLGRMVWNFIPDAKVWGISAWRLGLYFVLLDIFAFIVQLIGAATASNVNQNTLAETLRDLHVYMIGVGIQQAFILLFLCFAVKFHLMVRALAKTNASFNPRRALLMLYTLYAVVLLITMRIIFRLCEFAQGFDTDIPVHEAYQYCLDTLPMLLALVLLNVVHPGHIMPGQAAQIPGRRERRTGQIHSKSDLQPIILEEYHRVV